MPDDIIYFSSKCGRLRVRFFFTNDRYAHALELVHPSGDAQQAWASVEGTPDEPSPPSPPMQEVQACDMPDEMQCLLGTGMAGKAYWSLSVTQHDSGILFDVACRPKGSEPERFGSRYTPNEVAATEQISIVPQKTSSDAVPVIVTGTDGLFIEPVAEDGAATIRWAYLVRIAPAQP